LSWGSAKALKLSRLARNTVLIFVLINLAPSLASQLPQGLVVLTQSVKTQELPVGAGLPAMGPVGFRGIMAWLPADPAS
jgi:hypothetical protein